MGRSGQWRKRLAFIKDVVSEIFVFSKFSYSNKYFPHNRKPYDFDLRQSAFYFIAWSAVGDEDGGVSFLSCKV